MMKVFLVDDEIAIRENLRNSFPWEEKGYQLVGEAPDGEDLLLRVKDNGAGMTPEQLALLNSGAFEEHHSGLGLKNVHQRIRLYCGEPYGLSFDSAPGEGTTVTVRLPRRGVTAIRKEEDSHDR